MITRLVMGAAISVVAALSVSTGMAATPSCEPANVAAKYPSLAGMTIKIGADPQTPPYVTRDKQDFQKINGVDVDLAKAVFDCAGVKYEFVLGAWSGLLPAVQGGQIDVMWNDLYYKPARAAVVDFVIYMQAATGALVAGGNPRKIAGIDDLCGLTASFGLGSSNEITVQKQNEICKSGGKAEIAMLPFQDLASGLRLIDSGRADVILWDLGFVDNLVSNNQAKYGRAFAIQDSIEIGVGIAKGKPDLVQAISDGLRIMQADGFEKKTLQKYGVDPVLELPVAIKTQ